MGTAGPLALAAEILNDGTGDPFFVLNRWVKPVPPYAHGQCPSICRNVVNSLPVTRIGGAWRSPQAMFMYSLCICRR